MKKIVLMLTLCVLVLSGCTKSGTLNVEKQSKNFNTYTMDLTYNADNTLNGTQTLTYKNNADVDLTSLSFHLYVKAFTEGAVNKPVTSANSSKAYPNGPSYGDIEIISAKVDDQTADFVLEGTDSDILKVDLLGTLEPKDKTKIELEYKVYVPNINHRFGYGNNAINMANFYPIIAVIENGEFVLDGYHSNGDPFYSDCSNYDVTLTVPSEYKLASSGVQTNVETAETTSTYTINAKCVRDFAFVLSKKFEVATAQVGDTTVNYYYYDDPNFETNLQASVDALTTFNNLFGTYPYSTLSVVKTNFVHGGMEYPNLVYISDQAEGDDYINVIIHEIAHQWWYGVVGSNAYSYGWLDEGLTEYSTALFYLENPSYNVDYAELIKNTNNNYVTFVELYTDVLGKVDTSMNRKLNEYNTEPEYVYMAYVKGMLLFDNLYTLVGRDDFILTLQNYYSTYALQNVTPAEFIETLEKTCNRELESYINTWLTGKVVIMSMD